MESYYLELIKFGGGTALIVALVFLVREIGSVWKSRNGSKEVDILKEKVENEHHHLFEVLQQDIRDLK